MKKMNNTDKRAISILIKENRVCYNNNATDENGRMYPVFYITDWNVMYDHIKEEIKQHFLKLFKETKLRYVFDNGSIYNKNCSQLA